MTADLIHATHCAWASGRTSLTQISQYRADYSAWAVAEVLSAIVPMGVWSAVLAQTGGDLGGYSGSSLFGYFIAILVVRQLTITGPVTGISFHIRTGMMATTLLRPVHPLVVWIGKSAAPRALTAVMVAPAVVLLIVVTDATFSTDPSRWAVALLLVLVGNCVRIVLEDVIATAAFWTVRIDGVRGFYLLVSMFLSGRFAPIAFLPDAVETVARYLPFYFVAGYPVEMLTGAAPLEDVPLMLAVALGWFVIGLPVLRTVWRRGVRAHEAVGQ